MFVFGFSPWQIKKTAEPFNGTSSSVASVVTDVPLLYSYLSALPLSALTTIHTHYLAAALLAGLVRLMFAIKTFVSHPWRQTFSNN